MTLMSFDQQLDIKTVVMKPVASLQLPHMDGVYQTYHCHKQQHDFCQAQLQPNVS